MPPIMHTPPHTPAKGLEDSTHFASRTGTGIAGHRPKRFRRANADAIQGISKKSIRRMARRGGVKRIQLSIYNTTKEIIKKRVTDVMDRVVKIVDHCGRKTVNTMDIVMALKHFPSTEPLPLPVYGYGWPLKVFPDKRTRTRTRTAPNEAERARVAEIEKRAALVLAIRPHDDRAPSTPERPVTFPPTPAASSKKPIMPSIEYDEIQEKADDADDEDEEPWDHEADRESVRLQIEGEERVRAWVEQRERFLSGMLVD